MDPSVGSLPLERRIWATNVRSWAGVRRLPKRASTKGLYTTAVCPLEFVIFATTCQPLVFIRFLLILRRRLTDRARGVGELREAATIGCLVTEATATAESARPGVFVEPPGGGRRKYRTKLSPSSFASNSSSLSECRDLMSSA